jgi:hypothetical protein
LDDGAIQSLKKSRSGAVVSTHATLHVALLVEVARHTHQEAELHATGQNLGMHNVLRRELDSLHQFNIDHVAATFHADADMDMGNLQSKLSYFTLEKFNFPICPESALIA